MRSSEVAAARIVSGLLAVLSVVVLAFEQRDVTEGVIDLSDDSSDDAASSFDKNWHGGGHGGALNLGEEAERPDDTVRAEASPEEKAKSEKAAGDSKALSGTASYSDAELKQIAVARMTPIANASNGSLSYIRKAGKVDDMVTEYMNATREQAAAKDVARIEGNKAIAQMSRTINPVLKAKEKQQYHMRQVVTNASLNAFREKWNQDAAAIRIAHAAGCKNLTRKNPYPKNSSQYKMVSTACKDEDSKNDSNQTAQPPGSHDFLYGPYSPEPTVSAAEVADVTAELAKQAPTDSDSDELD